eukprot:Skav205137  [mRNA]  locus=scaffold3411:156586:159013:- [translate_table: standard]
MPPCCGWALPRGALNLAIYGTTIAAFERENGIVRGEPKSILTASAFGEYFPNPGRWDGLTKEWGSGPYNLEDVPLGRLDAPGWRAG